MKPTRELIAAIRKACPKGHVDPDDWLADQLDRVRRTRSERAVFAEARRKVMVEAKKKVADIDLDEKRLQDSCPHYSTTYHPDPSGNNDSWRECDTCGKDLG